MENYQMVTTVGHLVAGTTTTAGRVVGVTAFGGRTRGHLEVGRDPFSGHGRPFVCSASCRHSATPQRLCSNLRGACASRRARTPAGCWWCAEADDVCMTYRPVSYSVVCCCSTCCTLLVLRGRCCCCCSCFVLFCFHVPQPIVTIPHTHPYGASHPN